MAKFNTADLQGETSQAPITASGAAMGNRAWRTPPSVAEQAIAKKQQIGKQRRIPIRLRVVERAKQNKIHIFNVGPWKMSVNTGSTGQYTIPACPFGTDYVELLTINGETGELEPPFGEIVEELVIKSEDEMTPLQDEGWEFVQQVLGLGRGNKASNALTQFGIFASWEAEPTKEEIAAAKEALTVKCSALCKWAGDTFSTNRDLFSKAVRPEVHFVAAKVLGRDNPIDSPWMTDAKPVGRIKCKMCGRMCDPDVATCEAGHVVNMELYLQLKAADEQLAAAIAAAPKKDK